MRTLWVIENSYLGKQIRRVEVCALIPKRTSFCALLALQLDDMRHDFVDGSGVDVGNRAAYACEWHFFTIGSSKNLG